MTEPGTDSKTDHAGVIVPPPLIYGGVLLPALLLDWAIDGPGIGPDFGVLLVPGAVLILAGLALVLGGATQFRRAETNIEPWKPSTMLVTTGLYRYSRNPIYLGLTLGYVGLCLLADSLLALVLLPVVFVIMHYAVIRREEQYLEIKFGQAYREYKARVRRWV